MKTLLTLLIAFIVSFNIHAQHAKVMLYGYTETGSMEVKTENRRSKKPTKLDAVTIQIFVNDELVSSVKSRETGFYATLLDAGTKYKIVFEKEGFHCKSIELDCTNVVYPDHEPAIKCMTDISLYPQTGSQELIDLCKQPFAKAKFDSATGGMEWDMAYTEKIRAQLNSFAAIEEK